MSTYRDVFLGRAPSGLSAPEDSELDSWYDLVDAQQSALLVTPVLTGLLDEAGCSIDYEPLLTD